MAQTINARVQFSTASLADWEKINPQLKEGELVLAKLDSGNYRLIVGAIGGSKFKDSVLVWDEVDAETLLANTQKASAAASASASAAKTSETNAKASETASKASETNAKASETASKTSETNAKASESASKTSESNAKTSATNAATSESNAKASETAAASSATASASSASEAKTSETNAKASETAAADSAKSAQTSETNAKTSETNAKASETNAAKSAEDAANSAKQAAENIPAAYIASVVKTALDERTKAMYPVGCYFYSDDSRAPSEYIPGLEGTTWEQTAAGRVLIGAGTADSGTVYNAGDTGGEEKHKLSADENGKHTHEQRVNGNGADSWANSSGEMVTLPSEGGTQGRKGYACKISNWIQGANIVRTGIAGGGQPHNTMQPYQVVYIFRRSA